MSPNVPLLETGMICSYCKWGDSALERLRVFSSKAQHSSFTADVLSARMAHPHQSRLGLGAGGPDPCYFLTCWIQADEEMLRQVSVTAPLEPILANSPAKTGPLILEAQKANDFPCLLPAGASPGS